MFDVDVAYTFHLAEHLGKTGASAPQIVDLWLQRRISPTTAGCELINLVLRVRISHSLARHWDGVTHCWRAFRSLRSI